MPDEKIKISWEDVNRPDIGAKVEKDRQLRSAAAHYQQATQYNATASTGGQSSPLRVQNPAPSGTFSFSNIGTMILAGLIAGVIAWAFSEPTNGMFKIDPDKIKLDNLDQVKFEINRSLYLIDL